MISSSPTDNVHGTLSVIRVTFDEDIDPTSVSLSDIVNFTGPGGTVEATSMNIVPGSRSRQIAIHFPTQDAVGTYQMTIGPQVLDRAGNLMNQDGDDTNGEVGEDTYTATVSLISTNGGPTDYVAFWQFDEGTGDAAHDTSGNALTGTLHGGLENSGWSTSAAPTSYAGAFSLDFDGTNDYVSLPSADGLNVSGNAVTVSVWVKLDELPADISGEDFASIFDSEQDAYVVYLDKNNDELRFKVTDATGAAERPGIPSAYLDTSRWHHVTGVYDGSTQTASIYLDGALMDAHTNPSLGASVRSGQVAAIGRNGNTDRYYFNGGIDDIRIYDRALGPGEVAVVAQRRRGVTLTPTTGLETSESGRTDTFQIVLDARPLDGVTIGLTSSAPTEGTVTPTSVTFTPTDWDTPQTVTVTGIDDQVEDGTVEYTIVTAAAVSADEGYHGIDPGDVLVANRDNEGLGGPADYVAYWKLDEGTGSFTADSSGGGLDGVLQGGLDATGWLPGAAPTSFDNSAALSFDGANDYISLPAHDTSTNAVTLSTWVKLDRLPNSLGGPTYASIFDSTTDSFVLYEDDKTNELRFKVTDADGTTERPGISPADLDTIDWHHIAGVYDGILGKASIYLDGELKDVHTNSQLTGVVKPGQVAALGRNGTSSNYYFDGSIDDVRVYDRALDAAEIVQLAARQAAITIYPSRNLLTTEAGTSDSFTVVLDAAPTADVTIGISSNDPSEGLAMPTSVTFTPANWDVPQTVLVTGVDDLEVDDAADYLIVTSPAVSVDANYNGLDAPDISVANMDNDGPGGPHDYVAYWKLDEGAGGTAIDSSGGGNHGTLLGGADTTGWIADVAPTGFSNRYALDFDGTNDSVALPAGGSLEIGGNAVSISLWVKLDELPNAISGETYAGIFDSEQDSYVIYEDDTSDELRFKVTDADGTAERPGIPASQLDTVRWHHIVGVYDGAAAEALIYLDGSLADAHFNSSLTGQVKPGQIPALGRNGTGSKYFYNGQIDDVRVYDRALSQAEIFALSGQIAQITLFGFPADTPRAKSEWPLVLARIENIKHEDGPLRKTEEPVNEYMAAQANQPVPILWMAPFSEPNPSDDEFETIRVEGSRGFESSVDVLMEAMLTENDMW